MKCPFCHHDNDKVIDSRSSQDAYAIRRRRECLQCGRRYTTYERLDDPVVQVVKKDGAREAFDRQKIKAGLVKACWKRPVSAEQIDELVNQIENVAYVNLDSEVESRTIGELVMRRLRHVDQVAFVRFASVYREFKDVRDFVEELEPMLEETRGTDK